MQAFCVTQLTCISVQQSAKKKYVVGQLSSRTRHHMLTVAALNKSLSMVWWHWHISVSQLCCCWSMAVSFCVAPITVCVCFGVPPWECKSLNQSSEQTLYFLLNLERVETKFKFKCKFTGITLWRKQQFTIRWNTFLMEEKVSLMKREIRMASNKQNWRKHCKN